MGRRKQQPISLVSLFAVLLIGVLLAYLHLTGVLLAHFSSHWCLSRLLLFSLAHLHLTGVRFAHLYFTCPFCSLLISLLTSHFNGVLSASCVSPHPQGNNSVQHNLPDCPEHSGARRLHNIKVCSTCLIDCCLLDSLVCLLAQPTP